MKMQALVATLIAMFAESVGFLYPRKTHGSHEALAVATPAIFIRGGELEKVMGHSLGNLVSPRKIATALLPFSRTPGDNRLGNPPSPPK